MRILTIFKKDFEELRKQNQQLRQPMDFPETKQDEKSIEDKMKEATEDLEQQEDDEQIQEDKNEQDSNQNNDSKKSASKNKNLQLRK